MNQNFPTEPEPSLVDYIARGAIGGAAASLILLPAVSYLARRESQAREGAVLRVATAVAARLGKTPEEGTVAERPLPFARHVLTGAAWGAFYGAAAGSARLPTVPTSSIFGVVLPALAGRFLPTPLRLFPSVAANSDLPAPFRIGVHLLWGSVLGLAYNLARMVISEPTETSFETTQSFGQSRFAPPPVATVEVVEVTESVPPTPAMATEGMPSTSGTSSSAAPPAMNATSASAPEMNAPSASPPPLARSTAPAPGPTAAPVTPPPPEPARGGRRPLDETMVVEPPSPATEPIAPRRPVGAGSAPLAGTMPGGPAEAAPPSSYAPSDLVGKMVFSGDGHALGDVRKVEEHYVEIATPVVELGPTMYVPYPAFQFCTPRGCYLRQPLDALPALDWNTPPASILEADTRPGLTPGAPAPERPRANGIEIPYLPNEDAVSRFREDEERGR